MTIDNRRQSQLWRGIEAVQIGVSDRNVTLSVNTSHQMDEPALAIAAETEVACVSGVVAESATPRESY